MANRTDPAAKDIRGTNPQNLVEKILRTKIYQSTYWKEHCFGLNAETLVDKALELNHLGGDDHGNNGKPTPFMCLVLKMLQIQPEKDIVVEFIIRDYKYVRVLGAFYLRLTGTDADIYQYLEPLYNDYRKLRKKQADGRFTLTHVDEVIHELLTSDYSCDIALPRINKRWDLERIGTLEPRISALEDDVDLGLQEDKEEDHHDQAMNNGDEDHRQGWRRPTIRERDREPDTHRDFRDRDYDRRRERDRDRDYYGRERGRERDIGSDRERRVRDRGRGRRSRSRSQSRSTDRKDREVADHNRKRYARRSTSPRRHAEDYGGNAARDDKTNNKKKPKKIMKEDGTDHPDPEIAEQNRLRASLGLKPLRV